MAKKKATGGLDEGARIRVKEGVASPDFPDVLFSGWTGSVVEVSGKPPAQKFIVEWDAPTISAMPPDYLSRCEAQMLYHAMACLGVEDLELA
ncbi:MAG: hypothetical protein JSS49_19435 [Planctomycetes bacterium]|nr:hypothetical protein [Planctomycetota bacterium]